MRQRQPELPACRPPLPASRSLLPPAGNTDQLVPPRLPRQGEGKLGTACKWFYFGSLGWGGAGGRRRRAVLRELGAAPERSPPAPAPAELGSAPPAPSRGCLRPPSGREISPCRKGSVQAPSEPGGLPPARKDNAGKGAEGSGHPLPAPPGQQQGRRGGQRPAPSPRPPLPPSPPSSGPQARLTPDASLFRAMLSPGRTQAFGLGLVQARARHLIPFQGLSRYFGVQMERCSIFILVCVYACMQTYTHTHTPHDNSQ